MTVGMNDCIQINSLKIPPAFETIPISDCLANGFFPLNPIMPDLSNNYFSRVGNLVVAPNCRERTAGDAIRRMQHNRTGSAFAKKFFYMLGDVVEVILRSARCKAVSFSLLDLHNRLKN